MLGLNGYQIYPGVHYRDNTTYPMYASMRGTCPRSLDASSRLISLPLHMRLTRQDTARISDTLREILARLGRPA